MQQKILPQALVSRLLLEFARLDRKRTREGLSVAELERWSELKGVLNHHFSPGLEDPHADRRQSVRIPTRLQCSFQSLGRFRQALITNLSSGGLFISTSRPLPIGSRLNLHMRIEGADTEIEVPCVVVSQNVSPSSGTSAPGMGVRFSELVPQVVEQLNELYHRTIERHCAPSEEPGEAKKGSLRGN